jgi:hypothetical protein
MHLFNVVASKDAGGIARGRPAYARIVPHILSGCSAEPSKLMRVPTIPHMSTIARKYVIVILANVMTDIAGGALQLFHSRHITIQTKICGMMWEVG